MKLARNFHRVFTVPGSMSIVQRVGMSGKNRPSSFCTVHIIMVPINWSDTFTDCDMTELFGRRPLMR